MTLPSFKKIFGALTRSLNCNRSTVTRYLAAFTEPTPACTLGEWLIARSLLHNTLEYGRKRHPASQAVGYRNELREQEILRWSNIYMNWIAWTTLRFLFTLPIMGIWRRSSFVTPTDIHGASSAILVCEPLVVGICRLFNGVVPTDVHGTRGLALVRPKVAVWIYCNGVATTGVHGIHGRVGTLINLTFSSGVTNVVVRSSIMRKINK
jgi:hypothetical protein